MKLEHCTGCHNDDYNHGLGGATQCLLFDKSKKLEQRYILHKDLMPPFKKHHIRKVPPCYQPQGYACVGLKSLTEEGYWK